MLIREIGPLWVSSFRVGIGALGCWAVMLALRKPIPRDPVLWFKLGALGILLWRVTDLAAWATPFADGWADPWRPLARLLLAVAVVVGAVLLSTTSPLVAAEHHHLREALFGPRLDGPGEGLRAAD